MKKILLASTVVLSMAGFAKTSVYAEESQVTKKTQTTDVVDKKEETAPPKKVPQATPKKRGSPSGAQERVDCKRGKFF